jgi:hypothetical protein
MSQYVTETTLKHGHLELENLPFKDNTKVEVIVTPKTDFSKLSIEKMRELTKGIKGNLADDVNRERNER